MFRVQLACDGASVAGARCPVFESSPVTPDEADGWVSATLDEQGWIRQGDQHFCPAHNPALVGKKITIRTAEYTEIAPGVRVRMPSLAFVDELAIEVQTQYRECHGCVGEVCGGGNGVYEPGTEWGAWHKPDEKGR